MKMITNEHLQELPRGAVIRINHLGFEGLARNNGYNQFARGIEYTAIGGGGSVCKADHVTEIVADSVDNCPAWDEAERAHFGPTYTPRRKRQ